jgi:hypothetical protein
MVEARRQRQIRRVGETALDLEFVQPFEVGEWLAQGYGDLFLQKRPVSR